MEEEWKDIEGYENKYQVSNLGRVKSLKSNIIMKQNLNKKYNRYSIMLWKNGKSKRFWVARLVAKAFVFNPNPNIFTQVNHKDENKTNNNSNNLEWCTVAYNNTYGTRLQRQANTLKLRNKLKNN